MPLHDKRECKYCGKEYWPNTSKQMYCNRKCSSRGYNEEAFAMKGNKTKQNTGDMGEYFVCADLIDKGFYVFKSICTNNPVDIVCSKDGDMYRVEVKTARVNSKSGSICYSNPRNDSYDVLALYIIDDKSIKYISEIDSFT